MSTAASSTTEPVHAEAENEAQRRAMREPRAATQTDSSDSGWLAPA